MKNALQLVDIDGSEAHVIALFDLLSRRRHRISHQGEANLGAHRAFVASHPYLAWVLVKSEDDWIGSIYLKDDNTIGINFDADHYGRIVESLDRFLQDRTPLPAIPSVRNAHFLVNVPETDAALREVLAGMGALPLQRTYRLG